MKWFLIPVIILGVLLILTVALTLFFFSYAVRRNNKYNEASLLARMKTNTRAEFYDTIKAGVESFRNAKKQDVFITSRDGLRLHGYLWEQPDREKVRGTAVLVHGWRSCPQLDFSASWEHYCELGFDILFIDQRAQGQSEGKYICFGTKERFDLIDWLNFINQRYGTEKKIFLCGVSMGSSTVLMSIGEAELPANVTGAIADCGFTSAWDEFAHVLRRSYHLPKFPLLYTTDLLSRAVADFPFRAYSTVESLKKAKVPVLFIHGSADGFVPPEHSRINASACASPCELIEVDGASHGISYLCDTKTVKRKADQFLDIIIP